MPGCVVQPRFLSIAISCAQEFARQQFARATFDYRRLCDEFGERVVLECAARHVTPLVKQPGILVVTDRGLYFQPLHNVSGGDAVKFHPAQARPRRRGAMQC
jgi:hypothetical protein